MATTDCIPTFQCLSGIIPDECRAAGLQCASLTSVDHAVLSTPSPLATPSHHVRGTSSSDSDASTTSSRAEYPDTHRQEEPHNDDERRRSSRPFRPHRRTPHVIVERRYRDNLNTQIESLRLTLPTLRDAYAVAMNQDLEDSTLPPRLPSKAVIIATATGYIKELEGQRDRAEAEMKSLEREVSALRRAVVEGCGDCSILQYLKTATGEEDGRS